MEELFLMFLLAILVITPILYFTKRKRSSSYFFPPNLAALAPKHREAPLECPLVEKTTVSHDTFLMKFALPRKQQVLGIHVGQHIIIHEKIQTIEHPEGEQVDRKYTPVSLIGQKGSFDLLIKIYRPNEHPRFPNGGKFTSWIDHLKIDRPIHISGPYGGLMYQGYGKFRIRVGDTFLTKNFKNIVMIAGGSGITPMYQIIHSIINDEKDTTRVSVLLANKTESDILCYEELKVYAKLNKLNLFLTLDSPPDDWTYFKGFVSADMVQQAFGQIDQSSLCLSCGPGPMNDLAKQHFKSVGATQDNIHVF